MNTHQRWAALRRMQRGAAGPASAEQLALAHADALANDVEDESERYFGYLTGWLGSVRWALGDGPRLGPGQADKEHLKLARAAALKIGIVDGSPELAGYQLGWLGAVIWATRPASSSAGES